MSTLNQQLPARIYTKQYLSMLSAVFAVENAFPSALTPLQALDGIRHNATAFTVKTCNTAVVVGTYNKDANVGFGTGTGSTSRFGNRTEVIYSDTDVPYTYELAMHEGIDIATVNAGMDEAVADRFELQAKAQTRTMNKRIGDFIATKGTEEVEIDMAAFTDDKLKKLFNDITKFYINKEVSAPLTAYIDADIYNALIDSSNTVSGKGSSISIDSNGLAVYKDIKLKPTPLQYFATGYVGYVVPDGIITPFIGAEIARAIESEDFAGMALQAYSKGGQFMLDDNAAVVYKIKAKSTITLSSTAGTNSGDTAITVTPAKEAGNSYKYKTASTVTEPNIGQTLTTGWKAWDGVSDITATTDNEIVIAEVDDKNNCVKFGKTTVVSKA